MEENEKTIEQWKSNFFSIFSQFLHTLSPEFQASLSSISGDGRYVVDAALIIHENLARIVRLHEADISKNDYISFVKLYTTVDEEIKKLSKSSNEERQALLSTSRGNISSCLEGMVQYLQGTQTNALIANWAYSKALLIEMKTEKDNSSSFFIRKQNEINDKINGATQSIANHTDKELVNTNRVLLGKEKESISKIEGAFTKAKANYTAAVIKDDYDYTLKRLNNAMDVNRRKCRNWFCVSIGSFTLTLTCIILSFLLSINVWSFAKEQLSSESFEKFSNSAANKENQHSLNENRNYIFDNSLSVLYVIKQSLSGFTLIAFMVATTIVVFNVYRRYSTIQVEYEFKMALMASFKLMLNDSYFNDTERHIIVKEIIGKITEFNHSLVPAKENTEQLKSIINLFSSLKTN